MAKEIHFMSGEYFPKRSRDEFTLSEASFEKLDFGAKLPEKIEKMVERHIENHGARYSVLKRYYEGDNNINYREAKLAEDAADRRIANPYASYMVNFAQGYLLGKPVTYSNENPTIQTQISEMTDINNDGGHNTRMAKTLSIYGVAFELMYVDRQDDKSAVVRYGDIPPSQVFVIYDTTINPRSLVAVRHYFDDDYFYVEIYSDSEVIDYAKSKKDGSEYKLVNSYTHPFKAVPITEFRNNDELLGDFEQFLPQIDAIDSQDSEQANFVEDNNNAILLLFGQPNTAKGPDYIKDEKTGKMTLNPNGRFGVARLARKMRMMIFDRKVSADDVNPDARYLQRQFDVESTKYARQSLESNLLRLSSTPDLTDEQFASNASGVAMRYKLMAADTKANIKEEFFRQGIMRRLRLAAEIWAIRGNVKDAYNEVNKTTTKFTRSLPADLDGITSFLDSAKDSGAVSRLTMAEVASSYTGVSATDETARVEDEASTTPEDSESFRQ